MVGGKRLEGVVFYFLLGDLVDLAAYYGLVVLDDMVASLKKVSMMLFTRVNRERE